MKSHLARLAKRLKACHHLLMIDYVHAHNPDDRVLEKAKQALLSSELICLPTDTNWTVLADPYDKKAVERLYHFKKENDQKHFALLTSDISMASEVAMIDDRAFKLLKKVIPGHYTFIFEAKKQIAKHLKASKTDKEVGLRFVPSELIQKFLHYYGKALLSTNIPAQILEGYPGMQEIMSFMIEEKYSHLLKCIIDPGEVEFVAPSSIVDFSQGEPTILREGPGDLSLFY